jgi:hypothetical protein
MSYSTRIKKWIDGILREEQLTFEQLADAKEYAGKHQQEVRIYNNNNDQLVHVEPAKGETAVESYA